MDNHIHWVRYASECMLHYISLLTIVARVLPSGLQQDFAVLCAFGSFVASLPVFWVDYRFWVSWAYSEVFIIYGLLDVETNQEHLLH